MASVEWACSCGRQGTTKSLGKVSNDKIRKAHNDASPPTANTVCDGRGGRIPRYDGPGGDSVVIK